MADVSSQEMTGFLKSWFSVRDFVAHDGDNMPVHPPFNGSC